MAERLRRRVATRKVPCSNPVVETAFTRIHQLSIASGSVKSIRSGISIWGTHTLAVMPPVKDLILKTFPVCYSRSGVSEEIQ